MAGPPIRRRRGDLVSYDRADAAEGRRSAEAAGGVLGKADVVEEKLREARERFKLGMEAEAKQREREIEDLRFDRALPEDQWPSDLLEARRGQTVNGRMVAARPCLVINKLDQPVQQIINEAKRSRLSIKIKPKGTGNKAGATLRQGMIRSIEVDSNANVARFWALDRAAKCGRGYYRILTEYANDGDFDLDIRIARILNQHTVLLDPYRQEPDGSDAQWAFLFRDMPRKEFKRRYTGKSRLADAMADDGSLPEGDYADLPGAESPEWVTSDNVRVAEYFYIEYRDRVRLAIPKGDGTFEQEWEDVLLDNPDVFLPEGVRRRTVQVPVVKWCVIDCCDILDEEDWPGRYIPVIEVIGKEYNVKGERTFKGVISNSKDAQRSYNYMRSRQVEAVGLAPNAPFVMAEGQDEGYEEEWAESNIANLPYLTYKPTTLGGHLMPPPQRNVTEPAIQAVTMAVREADSDIKATTGRFDPSLGQADSRRQSGKAIRELKEQGEQSSSNYLDNLASISMVHEGKILLDLLPKIYDRPGRIIRLLGDDEQKEEAAMLGLPFVSTPNGPQAVPAGQAPPMAPQMPGQMPAPTQPGIPGLMPGAPGQMPAPAQPGQAPGQPPKRRKLKTYDLTVGGDYSVVVSVGPNTQTQNEANAAMIETLMEAVPAVAPVVADIYAKQFGGPMADELAGRLKAVNPQLANLPGGEDGEMPTAEELAGQVAQMQQQQQQLQQALQQAQQELANKKYQVEADERIAGANNNSREEVATLVAKTQLAIARLNMQSKEEIEALDQEQKQSLQAAEFAHERMMERIKARHTQQDTATGVVRDTLAAERDQAGQREQAAREEAREQRSAAMERARQAADQAHEREMAEREARDAERARAQQAALDVATRPPEPQGVK